MSATGSFAVQILTTVGVGGIVLALINNFFTRRARRADPAKALVESSMIFTDQLQKDNTVLKAELRDAREEQKRQGLVLRQAFRYIEALSSALQQRAGPDPVAVAAALPAMPEVLRAAYDERS